ISGEAGQEAVKIVTRGAELRALSRRARQSGMTVGFVPTMGSLHEGHLSLIRRARGEHHRVAVSVFVNPLQFGPTEDFARYPRDEVRDVRLCRDAGTDWFFLPRVRTLYPPGFATTVDPGPLVDLWEEAERPGHFRGVATVARASANGSSMPGRSSRGCSRCCGGRCAPIAWIISPSWTRRPFFL